MKKRPVDPIIYCVHCWIRAIPVTGVSRTIGKGDPAPYRHSTRFDSVGNAFCGKEQLTEADVSSTLPDD